MSANGSNRFLNIEDANLRVRSGNVHAKGITVGGITVGAAHGLQSVSDVSNTTSNTLQFTNATTSFKATSNIEVGGDVSYTSKPKISVESNVVTEYTGPHDRPLRKYPEVALTADAATSSGYKGYKVTFSAQQDTDTRAAFRLFDHDTTDTNRWQSGGGTYNTSSPHAAILTNNLPRLTDVDGTNHDGQWVGLQLPVMIKLDHIKFTTYQAATRIYSPSNYVILGSNTGLDNSWNLLKEVTDQLYTTNKETVVVRVNAMNKYKYYVWLIKNLGSTTGTSSSTVIVPELEYYGHEEGSGSLDTTLKSVYNVPATTGTQLEVYYDAKDLTTMPSTVTDLAGGDQNGTVTGHSPTLDNNSFVFDGTGDYIESTLTNDSGAWIFSKSLWFKQTVEPTNLSCMSSIGDYSVSDATFFYLHRNHILISIYSSGAYFPREWVVNEWTHAVAVMKGTTSSINDIELYINGKKVEATSQFGTATTRTLPTNAQLRVGREVGSGTSYFTGSIANFRLYSKALNADQIKELYDYQKDYFLGSKSQVTLYKGHLGVGVTEPSGQLELAGDERIQEYPPRGLTGYETYMEGHGVFCASASTEFTASFPPYEAFNDSGSWITKSHYNTTVGQNGVYTGSVSTNGVAGEWLEMKSPYGIKIYSFALGSFSDASSNRQPRNFVLFGSNDGNVWNQMKSVNNLTSGYTTGGTIQHNVNSTEYYTYFRVVVSATQDATDGLAVITRLQYFGTPGPTTLDKGSLSLTRSLDVPRVSRYDVDTETPRPEKLVVDFDTTVNSSPTDISGQGNNGAFYPHPNGASYSATDKAFNFDGTNDSIRAIISNPAGDWVHSISFWFKLDIDQSTISGRIDPFTIGRQGTGGVNRTADLPSGDLVSHYSSCDIAPTTIDWYFYGNDARFNISGIKANEWHHLTFAYEGGGAVASRHAFFDGVEYPNVGTSTTPLDMFANSILALGVDFGRVSSSPSYFDGKISNFKIYNAYLEPSEVQKLYRLGRTGRSMVISDTAVGIGKVPEAQLDVRGTISATGDIQVYSPDGISKIRTGKVGTFFQTSGRTIDTDTSFSPSRPYSIWESNVAGEGSYIAINGDNIVMCSPCDDESLRYYDEDNGNEVWNISNAGALVVGSDSRRKHDIKPVIWENVLKKIGNIEPSTFKFKHPESYTRVTSKWDKEHIGFIAQNVQENFPELVTEDGSSENYLLVNSSMMILPIIQGIQQLTNELQAEKAKNEALETQVSDLLASENAQIVLLQNVVFSLTKRIEALENA